MKRILFAVFLTLTISLLLSCNKDKKVYSLELTRIGEDTIFVGRDSSASTGFYFNSDPGLDVDYINTVAYDAGDEVEDHIQTTVVPYPGLQKSGRATVTIYAEPDCPVGEYTLRCFASNGKASNTITYILNVR